MDLYQALKVNDQNIALRRQFLGLGTKERQVMEAAIPWIERNATAIAKGLYDHQMGFQPTLKLFERFAAKRGITVDALRAGLERAVREEIIEMFGGSRIDWGPEYFRRLVRVGETHNRINLPQKWYVGLYAKMFDLIVDRYRADHQKGDAAFQLEKALFKVMNLGIQAVGDAFFLSAWGEAGLDVSNLKLVSPEMDSSELQGEIKQMIAAIFDQCSLIARNALTDPKLDQAVPGKLGQAVATTITNARTLRNGVVDNSEALAAVSSAVEEMKQAVGEISRSTAAAVTGMEAAEALAQKATQRMASLNQRSQEIGNVVKLITSIADQTNLLALNATIEAARSGEAGRGFAVVANEVKELARQAAEATDQIRKRIQAMQSETTEAVLAIDQIGAAIGSIAEASQSIASAVEEQSAVNDKLADDMQQAVARTRELIGNS